MVLEAHEERAGDQRLAGLGLDDLQRRAHGVGGRVDRAGDQTVGLAEHHQHRAEIAGVGQRLAGLLLGHALLGTQLAQLGDHGGEHFFIVHRLERGLVQRIEPQLPSTGQDRVLVADDNQVDDVTLEQIVGRLDDAVLLALGQHDGLSVGLGLAQQAVLERVRRDRSGIRGVQRRNDLGGGHVGVERGSGGVGVFGIGEVHRRNRPDRDVTGQRGLDLVGVLIRAAGHEHAQHLGAGLAHHGGAGGHGVLDLLRGAVDGAYGQEHGGGQIRGDIGVEREQIGIVDRRAIGADDHHGLGGGRGHGLLIGGHDIGARAFLVLAGAPRAHADGLFAGDAGIGRGKQHIGEGVLLADRRTEHAGLLLRSERTDDAVGDDVASVGGLGAENADGGKTHDVSLFGFCVTTTFTLHSHSNHACSLMPTCAACFPCGGRRTGIRKRARDFPGPQGLHDRVGQAVITRCRQRWRRWR